MKTIFVFLLLLSFGFNRLFRQPSFDRTLFYTALTGQNLNEINSELTELTAESGKEAFRGALLMKKAGMMPQAKDKLHLFKTGHAQLEKAITGDSTNAEFRFLRLLIQEHAPALMNYHHDLKKDASYIRKNYNRLPAVVQNAVFNYSKTSTELKPGDFKN